MSELLLQQALPGATVVVAIHPGKGATSCLFSTGDARLLVEPRSVSALRPGLDEVSDVTGRFAGDGRLVVAIEATGGLHDSWVRALEQRSPPRCSC